MAVDGVPARSDRRLVVLMVTPSNSGRGPSSVDSYGWSGPTRVDPWTGWFVVGKAAYSWQEQRAVIVVAEPDQVETDLAAGVLACPHCGGVLRPWAYAASRQVRQLHGTTRTVRPPPAGMDGLILAGQLAIK